MSSSSGSSERADNICFPLPVDSGVMHQYAATQPRQQPGVRHRPADPQRKERETELSPPTWRIDRGCCGSLFFRLCSSSVSFILTRRAAIFLALTKGCSAHLVRSGRQRGQRGVKGGGAICGGGGRSGRLEQAGRRGGGGLAAAFHSDGHRAQRSLLL